MLMSLRRLDADESGTTIVELLMVIMMMSIIGGIVMTSLVTSMRMTRVTQQRYDALADLQKGVDRLAHELRAADPAFFPTPAANTSVVQVFNDFPQFVQHERYTYTFCSGARAVYVRREFMPATSSAPSAIVCPAPGPGGGFTAPAGTTPLMSNVDSVTFQYLTQAGGAPALQKDVFRIVVTAQRAVTGQAPISVTTSVRVRNAR